ncbi:MAG: cation:proton antiporter [Planctomycetes bacterium]|nr:cation:proton antiporter [Planctomycetota bacterium]
MEHLGLGILILLGACLFGGALGASFFQWLRIPQVVGYIAIGLIVGESGFKLVTTDAIVSLRPFNLFALGIIGFLVGGELRIDTFRKYARQFVAILLGEGLAAFMLVGVSTTTILYLILHDFTVAVAAGTVFGAIASATDPASTIDVLWEYRARGVVTTSITAIVALDDALAMTLYGLGTGVAQLLTSGNADFGYEIWRIAVELLGAILVGFIFAVGLRYLLRWMHKPEKALAISIGLILLLIGIANHTGMDIILAAMMMGFTLINLVPRRSEHVFSVLRGFSAPIYVLFFVLVGARLSLSGLPLWLWGIIAAYVVGRSAGKLGGAWLGAKITGAQPNVRKYLGFGLFAQGGVAVGLSIMASQHLSNIPIAPGMSVGDAIIFAVTATTLIVQVSGPPLVKMAIQRSGEAGRNITDEDVIASSKVSDMMAGDINPFNESMRLVDAVKALSASNLDMVPVVDGGGKLIGTISLQGMRNVLIDQDTWQWLLVSDVLEPVPECVFADASLHDALELMAQVHATQMPVINNKEERKPEGILDYNMARRRITDEVIHRQGSFDA